MNLDLRTRDLNARTDWSDYPGSNKWTWHLQCVSCKAINLPSFNVQPHERARWTKSRPVIGYPNGQDGAILPARDTGFVPQVHRSSSCVLSHTINPLLTQLARSRWLDMCVFMDPELGKYPAILTTRLVNNPYILLGWMYDVISHLVCIFYTILKLKYLLN